MKKIVLQKFQSKKIDIKNLGLIKGGDSNCGTAYTNTSGSDSDADSSGGSSDGDTGGTQLEEIQ